MTDGARYFADTVGAHWLMDIISTELPHLVMAQSGGDGFGHIKLAVTGKAATITADDGNGNVFWTRHVEYTDCPEGEWRFYMAPGGPEDTIVIMLPSEY